MVLYQFGHDFENFLKKKEFGTKTFITPRKLLKKILQNLLRKSIRWFWATFGINKIFKLNFRVRLPRLMKLFSTIKLFARNSHQQDKGLISVFLYICAAIKFKCKFVFCGTCLIHMRQLFSNRILLLFLLKIWK